MPYKEKIYNLKEAQKYIEKELNISVLYLTVRSWAIKGYLIGSVIMKMGKRIYTMYTEEDIRKFIEKYKELREQKKIRKNYTKRS